jgi:3-dehydroshikimate dehydratase
VVVTLVNTNQVTSRTVTVQGGGYGEHQVLSASIRRWPGRGGGRLGVHGAAGSGERREADPEDEAPRQRADLELSLGSGLIDCHPGKARSAPIRDRRKHGAVIPALRFAAAGMTGFKVHGEHPMIGTASKLTLIAALIATPALAQTTPAPIAAVAAGGPSDTGPEVTVLTVDRAADDEASGSLRWAVTTSNADPGRYRIEIVGAPRIVLKSPLPPIKGPVTIEGRPSRAMAVHSVIDGSGYLPRDLKSCPGAVQGQYGTNVRTSSFPGLALVDTRGVTLRGLEIRGFCIGVLVLRTSNSVIADNRIVRNIGGAGVMLSGDDGKGGSTSNTTLDNKVLRNLFLENGDGLELTRGAAFNLIADNDFDGGTDNLEQSQGIEILWGNDNTVVRNRFAHYSDGLQLNWGARNYIGANVFRDNAFGVSVSGAGNMIEGNDIQANGVGIAVRPEAKRAVNRISQNVIAGNGLPVMRCSAGGSCDPKLVRGGIVMGLPGLEHGDFVGSRGMGVVFDQAGAARGVPDAGRAGGVP